MVKIKIRSGRGTRVIDVDSDATKWTGAEFKAIQEARKKAAGNVSISGSRGTSRRKLSDIPEPKKRSSTVGMTRSTGRGTGTRKSRGSKN